MAETKKVDSKGRILLSADAAGSFVTVEQGRPGEWTVRRVAVVPASEEWLLKNESALNLVRIGLAQASEGEFAEDPRSAGDDAWIAELED